MGASLQGLDRGDAPPAVLAKRMLDHIGGKWWNVYIGGPSTRASGWTPELVHEYAGLGIERFMITYAGQGARGALTSAQGERDAHDALERAQRFGYGGNFPLCLDVELPTYNHAPGAVVTYVRAWCAAVRKAGARPGVYANPEPLKAFARGKVHADFVWVASWVTHGVVAHDAYAAQGLPARLWHKPGQRAWQYAGAYGGHSCDVLGQNVDLSVADPRCLAPPPGIHAARRPARPTRPLRRGDRGSEVVRLTRRLSVVPSRKTGAPYLDGARRHFDADTLAALKAFQAEHELPANGTYGHESAHELRRAVRRIKARREAAKPGSAAPAAGVRAGVRPARLVQLVHAFQRLDAEADKAWQRIEAYGHRRERLLTHLGAGGTTDPPGPAGSLQRIEHQLEILVELERRELAVEEAELARGREPVGAAVVEAGSTAISPPLGPNGSQAPAANEAAAPAEARRSRFVDLSDGDLDGVIDRLDVRLGRARKERIARLARVERRLMPHVHRHGQSGSPPVESRPHPPASSGPKGAQPNHRSTANDAETYNVVTPYMKSDSIASLQKLLNHRFERWRMRKRIDVDREYGEETHRAAHQICHGLGLNPSSYRDGLTPEARIKIRHPSRRSPSEHERGRRRKPWRAALRKRLASQHAGPARAIAYGRHHLGVHEIPAGSNTGPQVNAWNRAAGVPPGPHAYWCGSFVNACLHAAGLPNQPWLRACPTIEHYARGEVHGWSWHPNLAHGRPGDLVLYTEPGSAVAAHVELLVTARPFDVIGGNTSANPGSGSQSNGGCVAEHRRDPSSPALRFKGYARPPWHL